MNPAEQLPPGSEADDETRPELPSPGLGEPGKEVIDRGELYFLWHPTATDTFSGYGLTLRQGSKDFLAGLLMVDRPRPVDPEWLKQVENTFGEYQLVAMTATRERVLTTLVWKYTLRS